MGNGDRPTNPAVDWGERSAARPGRFTQAEGVPVTHAWDPELVRSLWRKDKPVARPGIEPQLTLSRWSYPHTVTNPTVFESLTPERANIRQDSVWYTSIAVRWQNVQTFSATSALT